MKKIFSVLLGFLFVCGIAGSADAIPYLQLDIDNGIYVGGTDETVYATTEPFTLRALQTPQASEAENTSDAFYISIALVPKTGPAPANLGSFQFAGQRIDATGDMVYGTPPLDAYLQTSDPGDLATHGIYDTYFYEYSFNFDSSQTVGTYNVQDDPGSFDDNSPGTGTLWQAFAVDISGLNSAYALHFDLYSTELLGKQSQAENDADVGLFAPFSHDAQSDGHKVPEPSTMLLLGTGLIGLAGFGRKKLFK